MALRSNLPQTWRGNTWTPARELTRLQKNIDRIFDDVMFPMQTTFGTEDTFAFNPPCDLEETEDHFLVSLDIPGIQRDQLKIEMRDNQLMIHGERTETREREGKRLNLERFHGEFTRTLTLPSAVHPEKIEASYENGVLQIAIPKSEESKTKLIPIKEQKGGIFGKLIGRQKDIKSEKVA